jgi:hypothetical protein
LRGTLRIAGMLAASLTLAGGALAQKICMIADLDGAQETPPTASAAKGTAYCVLDRDANTLTYTLAYAGPLAGSETLAHIHGFAAPGAPAGIKVNLALGQFKTGVWNYAETDEASIVAGLCYFNIHSSGLPGGEIRGQIVRSNSPFTFPAIADGAQETPPTASAAKAVGYVKFDTVTHTMNYSYTLFGLSSAETLAHFHGFSLPGVPSGIKVNLPLGTHITGSFVYPAGDEANYLAGLSYLNIHTTANPGGEIRGQVAQGCSNPSTYCTTKVNSQGCSPAIGWTGLPSTSGADNFHITCANVINNKFGLWFWGVNPTSAAPFLGGTLCVKSPTVRTPVQDSAGNPSPDDCSGTFDYFFSQAYMAANSLTAGSLVYGEWWYRDPPSTSTVGLSNAIQFEIR